MSTIDDLRKQIDAIDHELIRLVEARMDAADAVGEFKRERRLPVYDPAREEQLIADRLAQADPGKHEEIRSVLACLMDASKKRQRTIVAQGLPRVAYQGTAGGYGHEAAMRAYPDAPLTAYPLFADVLRAVASGDADLGVLPVENSSTGAVLESLELLEPMNCYIVGESYLAVRHCLLGCPGADPEGIREVFSHPQGLLQCGGLLRAHPAWKQTAWTNTAVSARHVASMGDPTQAALASRRAAEEYGLAVLLPDVQDRSDNYTRFMTVSATPLDTGDKLTLRVVLPHRPNALSGALHLLAQQGANLTSITSRPLPGRAWEYQFYIDLLLPEGPEAMAEPLRSQGAEVVVLGRYPAGAPWQE